jgi:hypothetical protein
MKLQFNAFYNRFVVENLAGVVLSTTSSADGDFKYSINYSASSIPELVKQAEDDSNLLEFLYSELGSNDVVVTLDGNTFAGMDIMDHLQSRMNESTNINEKSFKLVQFRSEGKVHELPFSAYATDEVEAAKKVIDDKVEHGLIPKDYEIISIDGKPIVEAEEKRYNLFVVKSGNDIVWKKKVPSDITLIIQKAISNQPSEVIDRQSETSYKLSSIDYQDEGE